MDAPQDGDARRKKKPADANSMKNVCREKCAVSFPLYFIYVLLRTLLLKNIALDWERPSQAAFCYGSVRMIATFWAAALSSVTR
jgi:hypothetical protein